MSGGIAADIIRKFQNKNLLLQHLSAITGFILGAKVCDLFFFDQQKFEVLREDMEDEYWAKFGEPKLIKPYMVPSIKPGQEGKLRKSWIYIMYDKDKLIKKAEDTD